MNSYLVCLMFVGVVGIAKVQASCDSGWSSNNGKCYKGYVGVKTFANAKTACEDLGGYLAEPQSPAENNFIKNLFTNIDVQAFLGYKDINDVCRFKDRSENCPPYTNWNSNEPNHLGTNTEKCVEIYVKTGVWNNIGCGNTRSYVCEKA